MKTVGIFTYMYDNYGAVLQAYALQHYLEKYEGLDVEIVNFLPKERRDGYKIFKSKGSSLLTSVYVNFFTLLN